MGVIKKNKLNKRAVTAVVATALLIILAIVTVILFQTWFQNYNSQILVKTEKQSQNVNSLQIEQMVGNQLYLNNRGNKNLSIQTIKLGSYDCQINKNLSPGITKISLNSCLLNSPNNKIKEITVIEQNQIQTKSFYIDTSNLFVRPTLTFTASRTNLNWSEPVTLDWSSTGADNCSALGDWNGIKSITGSQLLTGLTSSKVYTLTCKNLAYSETKTITINVGNQDITPNNFSFTNLSNQNVKTTIESDIITIAGFSGEITGTIAGDGNPQFQQNGCNWTTTLNNFSSGDTIRLRLNTTQNYNTNHIVSLTLGDYTILWKVQTKIQDTMPENINFNDLFSQKLNSNITSNIVTLAGFDGPIIAQIIGSGTSLIKKNSENFTNLSLLLNPGDTIQLQLTTDNTAQKDFTIDITIGSLTTNWTVQSKNLNYNWNSTVWSSCGNTCGSGTQTRTVWCERADGQTVDDSNCIGPKPLEIQACSDYSTCSYDWLVGVFSSCSSTCGSGSQSRTVECERSDGTIVGDASCLIVKPDLSQSCTDYSTCTYQWISEAWSACSNTCGEGTHSRNVYCERSDGIIVDDSNCVEAKPVTSESCSVYMNCVPLIDDFSIGFFNNVEVSEGKLVLESGKLSGDYISRVFQTNVLTSWNNLTSDYVLDDLNFGYSTDLVPDMISATSPSGVVSQSASINTGTVGYKMFTDSGSDAWEFPGCNGWASYEFSSPQKINRYTILSRYSSGNTRSPISWNFQGYDGSSWITLDTRNNENGWLDSQKRTYSFVNENSYIAYRILTSDNMGGAYTAIAELEMMEFLYYSTDVKFQIRTSEDNVIWSSWLNYASGLIDSSAKYFQYKALLESEHSTISPSLNSVIIDYGN